MTTTTLTIPDVVEQPQRREVNPLGRVHDVWSMTRRNIVHISREPTQLSDVTIQPVLFTVLFVFIFGGGIPDPRRRQLQGLRPRRAARASTSSPRPWAPPVEPLRTDLREGIIDRFRALPDLARRPVLVGPLGRRTS